MIFETHGNVFEKGADIVAHQVNCQGVMGAGIAKQIRNIYMEPKDYYRYKRLCEVNGSRNLGHVFYCVGEYRDKKRFVIANCFGEDKIHPADGGPATNYEALKKCLSNVIVVARKHSFKTIAIPERIGCGLAGGDWKYVKNEIITPLFGELNDITFIISGL